MKVLVTGATRGIGRATALKLFEAGHEVTGVYENSEYEARELEKAGIKMIKCDISDADAVKELAARTGDIDALVNNAGVSVVGLMTDARSCPG